jgi:hypothetical protein
VIVTADELPDLAPLAMRASVNGTVWSEGRSAPCTGPLPISSPMSVHRKPIRGSPGLRHGGRRLRPGAWPLPEAGDIVTLEIEGIGQVSTTIDAPHVPEGLTL